jgi:hypothetical protein
MRSIGLVCAALVVTAGMVLDAQWINLQTPGLPRLPDGRPDLSAPAPRADNGKPDLSGLWQNDGGDRYYNNVAIDLRREDVAASAQALFLKRLREFSKDSMDTLCLPLGPAYLTSRYRERRIVQTPTLIMMVWEDGNHREIFLDGRSLEADPNPTWMGYSVGHWEDDVLVVESNGYTDRSWLDNGGHPHSDALRITERYRRINVGRIDVQVTMIDGAVYAQPITFMMPMTLLPDTEMLEGVCENHRNNSARISATATADVTDVPAATLAGYVGTYEFNADGKPYVVDVSLDGSDLWFDYLRKGKELLVPLSATRFSWYGTIVEFSTTPVGTKTMVIYWVENEEHGVRRR